MPAILAAMLPSTEEEALLEVNDPPSLPTEETVDGELEDEHEARPACDELDWRNILLVMSSLSIKPLETASQSVVADVPLATPAVCATSSASALSMSIFFLLAPSNTRAQLLCFLPAIPTIARVGRRSGGEKEFEMKSRVKKKQKRTRTQ